MVDLLLMKIISPAAQANTFKIEWKGRVEVHYRKEKVQTTIYSDVRYPISWVTAKRNFVLVNKEGIPLNPSDIVISGAMSKDRVRGCLDQRPGAPPLQADRKG